MAKKYLKYLVLLLVINACAGPNEDLFKAVYAGDKERVEKALEAGADVNIKDINGSNPLYQAARNGHLEVVRLLLDRGADFNMQNPSGYTPLNVAASHGHIAIVQLLLDKGADINRGIAGISPLYQAASKGHLEVVRLLLDRGADINVQNPSGYTPLILAARGGRLAIVQLLLDRGAIPTQRALRDAIQYGHANPGNREQAQAIIRLFIQFGLVIPDEFLNPRSQNYKQWVWDIVRDTVDESQKPSIPANLR